MRLLTLLFLVFLVGCAQVPNQGSYFLSYQKKLQASKHWHQITKKVANKVKMELENQSSYDHTTLREVFIQDYDTSLFGSTIRTLLTNELSNEGIIVSSNKESPYELNWKVQKVIHQANRKNKGGLLQLIFIEIPQFIFLGENDLGEYKPHSEVVITFMLNQNKVCLFSDSNTFYVNDEDIQHYQNIAVHGDPQGVTESKTYTVINEKEIRGGRQEVTKSKTYTTINEEEIGDNYEY